MTAIQAIAIALVAAGGAAVALTRETYRQAMLAAVYGVLLVVLFLAYQAPDVSLSALVAGSVAMPLMVLLTLAKIGKGKQ